MCRFHYVLPLIFVFCIQFALKGQDAFTIERFAEGLSFPLDIQNSGDSRLFVVEKRGRIQILDSMGNVFPEPFLDIQNRVNSLASERGLLGLAFHPDYVNNGLFFVNYTNLGGNTVIAKFSRTDDAHADPDSEVILLTVDQPYANHNGGCVAFGPDGYLYIGLGDGGDAGDPGDRAQNPQNLLGKMLRLDVDSDSLYSIPADNPFVDVPEVLDEIWALGLRNPWRYSFDTETGNLYIADVGQNAFEEINFQPGASMGGENYGWRCYEAHAIYNPSDCPDESEFTFPVHAYGHQGSSCRGSVTGGFVYRGDAQTHLYGKYVFAEYCKGWIAVLYKDEQENWKKEDIVQFDTREIAGFGLDADGEMYFAAIGEGAIYRILPEPLSSATNTTGKKPYRVVPNPAKEDISIKFGIPCTTRAEYTLMTIGGKLLQQGVIEAGSKSHRIRPGNEAIVPGSIVILRVTTNQYVFVDRVVLMR